MYCNYADIQKGLPVRCALMWSDVQCMYTLQVPLMDDHDFAAFGQGPDLVELEQTNTALQYRYELSCCYKDHPFGFAKLTLLSAAVCARCMCFIVSVSAILHARALAFMLSHNFHLSHAMSTR